MYFISEMNDITRKSRNYQGPSNSARFTDFRAAKLKDTDALVRCSRTVRKDPPGQSCVYIRPGDHRSEQYRLATYTCFGNQNVSICDLAKWGFYYTGFKDRTKCFSCGSDVENWEGGVFPGNPSLHESDCRLIRGEESQNVTFEKTLFRQLLNNFTRDVPKGETNARRQSNKLSPTANNTRPSSHSSQTTSSTKMTSLPELKMAKVLDQAHKQMLELVNLHMESDRRKTFTKWPTYPAPYLPRTLAQEGFFYLGNLDRVQCFSCSGVLRNWAPTDDVREQHQTHFPACRIHRDIETGNIEMLEEERRLVDSADHERLAALLPSGDVSEPPNPFPEEQRYLEKILPCSTPMNPLMTSLHARINTFRGWPSGKTKATAEHLAKAGMFYLGDSDKTKCFYCNGGLQNWDYNDEPWTEHAKWFPGCEFVNQRKGTRYVKQLADSHPNLNRPKIRNEIAFRDIPDFDDRKSQLSSTPSRNTTEITQPKNTDKTNTEPLATGENFPGHQESSLRKNFREMQETLTCRNCRDKKSDTMFLPCGHVVCCSECAANVTKCVACKTTVCESMKIYRA